MYEIPGDVPLTVVRMKENLPNYERKPGPENPTYEEICEMDRNDAYNMKSKFQVEENVDEVRKTTF